MNGQSHRIGGRNGSAALERAVECWGQPVGVEEARNCWSELVSLAESGTPTLITYKRSAWAVLAPLTELREPQWAVPMHQVTVARVKLSGLVRDVHGGDDGGPSG